MRGLALRSLAALLVLGGSGCGDDGGPSDEGSPLAPTSPAGSWVTDTKTVLQPIVFVSGLPGDTARPVGPFRMTFTATTWTLASLGAVSDTWCEPNCAWEVSGTYEASVNPDFGCEGSGCSLDVTFLRGNESVTLRNLMRPLLPDTTMYFYSTDDAPLTARIFGVPLPRIRTSPDTLYGTYNSITVFELAGFRFVGQ